METFRGIDLTIGSGSGDGSDSVDNAQVEANTANININAGHIDENRSDIADNTAAIEANAANIASNDTDIAALQTETNTNATNISNNTTAIENNTTAIETNTNAIQSNADAIQTNTSNIQSNTDAINNLETSVNTNTTNITNINNDISDLEDRVTTNESGIATNANNIQTNADDIDALETGVNALTTTVDNNTTAIQTNASNISNNTTSIQDNTQAITNLGTDVEGLETDITANTTNIQTNTNNITTNTADITALEAGLDTANTNIQTNADNIASNDVDIAALQTATNTNSSNISNNTTAINTNTANIQTNADDIDALENSINTVNTDISDLEDKVDTNTTNITSNANSIASNTTAIETNASGITANTTSINNLTTTVNSNTTAINNNAGNIQSNTDAIEELNTDISGFETDLSNLQTSVTNNTTNITANANDIDALENRVDTNENNIATNATAISTNATHITSNTDLINALTTRVNTNSDNIATNVTDIANNTTAINTNASGIQNNATDIAALQNSTHTHPNKAVIDGFSVTSGVLYHAGKKVIISDDVVDNLESDDSTKVLSAKQGKVLKQYIDSINDILSSDDINLDELQEIVDFIKANKNTLENLGISNITGLQAALDLKADKVDVDNNTAAIEANATAIQTNTTNIQTNADDIDALETALDSLQSSSHTHDNKVVLDGFSVVDNRLIHNTKKLLITDDIVDDLVTDDATKVLSSKQGKVLKDLIDVINAKLVSDDSDLDTLQEIVTFIKANKAVLDSLNIDSISGLQDALDLKADKVDVDALTNTVNTNTNDIDTLEASVASNTTNIQANTDDIAALQASTHTHDNMVVLNGFSVVSDVLNFNNVPVIIKTDIADNLTTDDNTKVLSAKQGTVIKTLIDNITATLASDDVNLDTLQEIVDFIKVNRSTLDNLGISDVNGLQDALDLKADKTTVDTNTSNIQSNTDAISALQSSSHTHSNLVVLDGFSLSNGVLQHNNKRVLIGDDIADDLTTADSNKVLSAKQGKVLKGYIDNIYGILTSNDTSLDELQEIVDFIKSNKNILDNLHISNIDGLQDALDLKANQADLDTTNTNVQTNADAIAALETSNHTHDNKDILDNLTFSDDALKYAGVALLDIQDVVDNLTSNDTAKPLSANQGKILKGLIDTINATIASDDDSLDTLQEVVNYIKENRETLNNLGISDITGLQAALDLKANKSDLDTLTATVNTNSASIQDNTDAIQDNVTNISANSTAISNLESSSHTHANKVILDKFTVANDALVYDNKKVIISDDVVDNLESDSSTMVLSAKQGKVLMSYITDINNILNSDDINLDELQEIVDFIKDNKETLDGLGIANIAGLQDALDLKADKTDVDTNTTAIENLSNEIDALQASTHTHDNKIILDGFTVASDRLLHNNKVVLIAEDIEDTLTSDDNTKVLSAKQGKVLKGLIDTINVTIASNDENLDTLQEVVDYIKENRSTLESLNIDSISGLQAALDLKADKTTVDTLTNTVNTNTSNIQTNTDAISALEASTHTHDNKDALDKIGELDGRLTYDDELAMLVADTIDNLTTENPTKPLSSKQGKVLKDLIDSINVILTSNDVNLDTIQEIVDYIKENRATLDSLGISSIDGLQAVLDSLASSITTNTNDIDNLETTVNTNTTNIQTNTDNITALQTSTHTHDNKEVIDGFSKVDDKIAYGADKLLLESDVIDNLTSTSTTDALSANMGKVLKGYIDSINTLLASDDLNLDELQEIVNFIKDNKDTLDNLGISNISGLQAALDLKADKADLDALTNTVNANTSNITSNTTAINALEASTHTHDNKEVIDKIVLDNDVLKYDGHTIVLDTIVQDSLTSTSVTNSLSANQGRLLKGQLDTLASTVSDHTDTIDENTSAIEEIIENQVPNIYQGNGEITEPREITIDDNAVSFVGGMASYPTVEITSDNNSGGQLRLTSNDIKGEFYASKWDVGLYEASTNTLPWSFDVASKVLATGRIASLGSYNYRTKFRILSELQDYDGNKGTVGQVLQPKVDNGNVIGVEWVDNVDGTTVVDNLTSTSASDALSANQGKILKGLIDNINTLLTSDDTTLDELQEIVDYIKQNKEDLSNLGINNISGLQNALDLKADKVDVENNADNIDSNTEAINALANLVNTNVNNIDTNTEAINDLQASTHSHVNKVVIDKFTEDNSILKYGDKEVLFTTDIIDNLASTSITDALSANQGKVLDDKITAAVTLTENNHNDITTLQGSSHTHSNKDTLDNITSAGDRLLYSGNSILYGGDVVDNLTTGTLSPVSAKQAKVLKGLIDNINVVLSSNDVNLDTLQEVVDYIKENRNTLEGLGISNIDGLQAALDLKADKIDVEANTTAIANLQSSTHTHDNKDVLDKIGELNDVITYDDKILLLQDDVVDNLTTNDTTKPLSSKQGKVLKGFIDNINTLLLSDDSTLDDLQEIVDFIKQNKETLDTLSISNISGLQNALDLKADKSTVDDLTTTVNTNTTNIQSNTDAINALESSTHTHDNKAVIDKFTEYNSEPYYGTDLKLIVATDVEDNLTSTAYGRPLSANQGRVLKNMINANHTIYDADGTLTSDRIVTIADKKLSFVGDNNNDKYSTVEIKSNSDRGGQVTVASNSSSASFYASKWDVGVFMESTLDIPWSFDLASSTMCIGRIASINGMDLRTKFRIMGELQDYNGNKGSDGQVLSTKLDNGDVVGVEWKDATVATTVVDNLESTSGTDALSANQGRVLKGLIDDNATFYQTDGEITEPRRVVVNSNVITFDGLDAFSPTLEVKSANGSYGGRLAVTSNDIKGYFTADRHGVGVWESSTNKMPWSFDVASGVTAIGRIAGLGTVSEYRTKFRILSELQDYDGNKGTPGQVLVPKVDDNGDVIGIAWSNNVEATTVIDNLTSTSITDALSANMGRLLQNQITTARSLIDDHYENPKNIYSQDGILEEDRRFNLDGAKLDMTGGEIKMSDVKVNSLLVGSGANQVKLRYNELYLLANRDNETSLTKSSFLINKYDSGRETQIHNYHADGSIGNSLIFSTSKKLVTRLHASGVYREITTYGNDALRDQVDNVLIAKVSEYKKFTPLDFIQASMGCLNPNPRFTLEDYDYNNYAALNGTDNRAIIPAATKMSAYGLKVKGYGSVLVGSRKTTYMNNVQLRAKIRYRGRVVGTAVDPSKEYKTRLYIGTKSYDFKNNFIFFHTSSISAAGRESTLAQPLRNGDTSVTIVTPATQFYNYTSMYHRGLRLYRKQPNGDQCYILDGVVYEHLSYSRWHMTRLWDQGGVHDNGDGTTTITFNRAWDMGDFEIGDGVVNLYEGGTYSYWLYGNYVIEPNEFGSWHTITSNWEDYSQNPRDPDSSFRPGTAYARFILLPNYRLYENSVILTENSEHMTEVYYGELALEWRHQD